MLFLNPAASVFLVACCGMSERIGNIIIPYGSEILRSLLRRAPIELCVFSSSGLSHAAELAKNTKLIHFGLL